MSLSARARAGTRTGTSRPNGARRVYDVARAVIVHQWAAAPMMWVGSVDLTAPGGPTTTTSAVPPATPPEITAGMCHRVGATATTTNAAAVAAVEMQTIQRRCRRRQTAVGSSIAGVDRVWTTVINSDTRASTALTID